MHRAKNNVDHSSSFTTPGSFDIFEVSKHTKSLFELSIDNHVKQKCTDDSDSITLSLREHISVYANINNEEEGYEKLHSKHNEALLESKTLLQRRTTLRHVGTNSVIVDILGESQTFVKLVIQLHYNGLGLIFSGFLDDLVFRT